MIRTVYFLPGGRVLFWVLLLLAPARAVPLHIGEITGRVWYGAPGADPVTLLTGGRDVDLGTLRVDTNGSAYLSPLPGATLRFGPGAEANFKKATAPQAILAFALKQGKVTSFQNKGVRNFVYQVETEGGHMQARNGLCVVCIHGDGGHVFPFRGEVKLFPTRGPFAVTGISLEAGKQVGALTPQGDAVIIPLGRAASATRNCLLSGGSKEIGAALESASPNPANLAGNPVVSPTQ